MKIFVKAKPGAKKERITENSDLFDRKDERHFVVSVKERAVDGEANRAIERVIAEHFGVVRARVQIVRGLTSRDKIIEVAGL